MLSINHIDLPPLNRCLYCGASGCELTREHIVPISLNGFVRFLKSSCKNCEAKINKSIETPMFGKYFKSLRDANRYYSRSRPKQFDPLKVMAPVEIVTTKGNKLSTLVPVLKYPPPRYKIHYSPLPKREQNFTLIKKPTQVEAVPGEGPVLLAKKPGVKSVKQSSPEIIIGLQERFLSKIAVGSMSAYSVASVAKSKLPGIVLGQIPYMVKTGEGTYADYLFSEPKEGLTGFSPIISLWERFEQGLRYLYCTIDIAPHIFLNNYFVRILSLETGPLLQETRLEDFAKE